MHLNELDHSPLLACGEGVGGGVLIKCSAVWGMSDRNSVISYQLSFYSAMHLNELDHSPLLPCTGGGWGWGSYKM